MPIVLFVLNISCAHQNELGAKWLGAITELQQKECLVDDSAEIAFVSNIFSFGCRRMHIAETVRVNQPLTDTNICIYVVRRQSTPSQLSANAVSTMKMLPDNFLAIPPNVILIDDLYLDYLALAGSGAVGAIWRSYVDSTTVGDTLARRALGIFDFHDELPVDVLDSNGISPAKFAAGPAPIRDLAFKNAMVNQFIRYQNIDGLRPEHPEHQYFLWSAQKLYRSGNLANKIEPFFALLVFHELAHLGSSESGVMAWENLDDYLKRYSPVYHEELRADSVAMATMAEYLKNDTSTFVGPFGKSLAFLEFCGTLRDKLVYMVYNGFRDCHPQDLFFTLEHKDQAQLAELETGEYFNAYPSLPTVSGFHFNNPDYLNIAYINSPPAMTIEEFRGIKKKLEEVGGSLTHQHLLVRAKEFFKLLPNEVQLRFQRYFYGFDQLYYLTSLSQEDLSLLDNASHAFGEVSYSHGLGISMQHVLYLIDSQVVVKRGMSLHGCSSWIADGADLHVEMWGDSLNLNKIIVLKKVHPKLGNDTFKLITNVAVFIRLLSNVFPIFVEHPDFLIGEYSSLLGNEFHTKRYLSDNILLTMGRLNATQDMIRVTVVSATNFPNLVIAPR